MTVAPVPPTSAEAELRKQPAADEAGEEAVELGEPPGPADEGRPAEESLGARAPSSLGGGERIPALERKVIQMVARRAMRAIRSCHTQALKDAPTLDASVLAQVVIGADGRVRLATVERGSGVSSLDQCVVAALQKLVFPPSQAEVTIRFPFLFKASALAKD